MWGFSKKRDIYMDFAAATPVRKEVLLAMQPFWSQYAANPSAIHSGGVAARNAVETARAKLARTLQIRTDDVICTGSGTESNNIAILGTLAQKRREGIAYVDMEIVSTAIEHPSVTNALAHAMSLGVTIKHMSLDEYGVIQTQTLADLFSSKTVLVTFAYANSEIGTVQPVGKIARMVRGFEKTQNSRIYVHIDAAQAPLWLPCSLSPLGVDIMSLDAGKCYGPKGVGVVAFVHDVTLQPIVFGGGQEKGLRPATENTPLIVGATEALCRAQYNYKKRAASVTVLRNVFIKQLSELEGVVLNGPADDWRIANNINVSIPGIDTEFATIVLDEQGIACSTKSACSGATGSGSSVVYAITQNTARSQSTLRFTLGEETKASDIAYVVKVLKAHITKTRLLHNKLTAN